MIRVGFIGTLSKEWMGGLNYFKNLLFALDAVKTKELEIFVFVGKKTDADIKNMFKKYANVIEDSLFDRKSIKWFFSKIGLKIFKSNFFLEKLLKKYNVEILSHSFTIKIGNIKTINWITDFQHIHLPDMFSKKEIEKRNKSFMDIIKHSDAVVVSSNDAMKDFLNFAPSYKSKAKVLHFVSQPHESYYKFDINHRNRLHKKYKLEDDFFYIPNQFWKHKNHLIVLKALDQLKREGCEINLVCSGYLKDYRNKNYIEQIKSYILENNLITNVKLLGLVDIEDVYGLIKLSKAVINPSMFEGWSSTVEECKSVGKNMILSDIDVHKEQYPNATFFERGSVDSLKRIIKNYEGNDLTQNIDSLEIRTKRYSDAYVSISKEILNI